MNLISKTLFGSKLYGTDLPGSDQDYRAVYLPPIEDCLTLCARDAWEDAHEEDTSYFSLQRFLSLACEGQSVAIELISAAPGYNVVTSPLWTKIHGERRRFYSKSMYSFLGYAKTMAGKYSSRVDRLRETEAVLAVLGDQSREKRLGEIWEILPTSVNCTKGANERQAGEDKRAYRVCGRELQSSVTIAHAIAVVSKIQSSYGERVRAVAEGRIEWKALMHAFRAAYQALEIAETGDLCFPLRDGAWLRQLRQGQIDFRANDLDTKLDELIAMVQEKLDRSGLPDHADRTFADSLILEAYGYQDDGVPRRIGPLSANL